jgi:predicted MFS family arabinose efflux permease
MKQHRNNIDSASMATSASLTGDPRVEQEHQDVAPTARPISYWALVRHNKAYRYLWLGQVISMAGDWFRTIALYALVLRLTGASGLALSGVVIAQTLPMFLFGPIAGVVVDRFNRKAVMIGADLLRALLTVGFLCITTADQVWLAYLLMAAVMAVSTFFHPAYVATIPNVTRREELVAANALGSATWAAMLAIGSGLGGVVTATLGIHAAFWIDVATYVISAVCIAMVTIPARTGEKHDAGESAPRNGWQEFVCGLRYMGTHAHIRRLLSVKAWSAGVGGGMVLLSALFAETVFQIGVTGMGMFYMVRGIGAVCGPLVARRLVGEAPRAMYQTIGVAFGLMAALYIVFASMPTVSAAALALCLGTMAANVLWVFSSTLLQISVPDTYRGRIFATDFALLTVLMALSTFVVGWAMDHMGFSPRVLATMLGCLLLLPAAFWLLPSVRRIGLFGVSAQTANKATEPSV